MPEGALSGWHAKITLKAFQGRESVAVETLDNEPPGTGISFPKKDGVYKGRSRALNDDQAAEVARRAATGEAKAAVNRYVSALPAQSMTIPIASIMATFVGAPQVLADFDL